MSHKFNVEHLDMLNDPKRLEILDFSMICRYFKLQHDMTLVEIGTGTGLFAEAFLNLLPEARCYALDIVPEMLEWIKDNRETYKNGRLIPLLMEEAKIPLEDDIADFLFMISLHHELNEPVELLKECQRILKPGGKILIADWRKDALDGPPVNHRIEPSLAISHLEEASFEDIVQLDCSELLFCIGAKMLKTDVDQKLTELVSDFKELLDSKLDRFRCFASHQTQLEGWSKGEILHFLDKQKQAEKIYGAQCEVKTGWGRRKVDIVLQVGFPPIKVWLELKYWLVGFQKGSRYKARFYFLDKSQGIIKDAKKLNQMQEKHTYILALAVTNPDRDDWDNSIKEFAVKFPPNIVSGMTNPDDFPNEYFLGLLKVSES